MVSNYDLIMKRNLKHSWEEKVKEGKMTMDEWPKTTRNKSQKDNGMLPLGIPEPSFLVEFNHRVKVVRNRVYTLASLPKWDSSIMKEIAERMKINWDKMCK